MAMTKRELEDLNEQQQATMATLRAEVTRLREENASLSEQLARLTEWSEISMTYYQRLKRSYGNLIVTGLTTEETEISGTIMSAAAGRAAMGEDGEPCDDSWWD